MQQDLHLFYWFHRLLDLLVPTLVAFALLGQNTLLQHPDYWLFLALAGTSFVVIAQFSGLYRQWRGQQLNNTGKLIMKSWFLSLPFLVASGTLFSLVPEHSVAQLIGFVLLPPFIFYAYRFLVQQLLFWLRSRERLQTNVMILGAGQTGQELARKLQASPLLGYRLLGFLDDNAALHGQMLEGVEVLGDLENLPEKLQQRHCHQAYICLPLSAQSRIQTVLETLADSTISVKFVPSLFSFDLLHTQWQELQGMPILSVYHTPMHSLSNRMLKRLEDLLIASIVLILTSPLLLLIGLTIRLTSNGPVLFKQTRYGLNGKAIEVYKFRSMTTLENQQVMQATRHDPRVTQFGRWLRKSSLDELPQFLNVLLGNMSVVGPRPHAVAHNEQYRKLVPKYMQRHSVKPGITGLAQINGLRGPTDTLEKMQKRVAMDLHYINTWSLWLDIKIFLLTLIRIFNDENAF